MNIRQLIVEFRDRALALILLSVLSVPVLGDGVGLPTNVCFDHCSLRQHQIWERFQQGTSVDASLLTKVYAGSCYVTGPNVSAEHEHHVGFLIDRDVDRYNLYLRFSFFAAEQPYDSLNASQVKNDFAEPVLDLSFFDGYAYADTNAPEFFARYWFRQDRSTDRVLLVSYFGWRNTILCETGENRYALR